MESFANGSRRAGKHRTTSKYISIGYRARDSIGLLWCDATSQVTSKSRRWNSRHVCLECARDLSASTFESTFLTKKRIKTCLIWKSVWSSPPRSRLQTYEKARSKSWVFFHFICSTAHPSESPRDVSIYFLTKRIISLTSFTPNNPSSASTSRLTVLLASLFAKVDFVQKEKTGLRIQSWERWIRDTP